GIRDFHVTGVQTCALPIYAVAFYELALTLCDIVDADPALRVLAKRSAGRARLRAGDLATAEAHYRGALEVARLHDLPEHVVIALTGLGNLASLHGRWQDAEQLYRSGLEEAGEAFPTLRGQLWINLSMTSREQGKLDDAAAALAHAREVWDDLSTADRAVWFNNQGLLHL